MRLILNGKKAGIEAVRSVVYTLRDEGPLEVRVTWEAGDVDRLVKEAIADGCSRLVIGGGDGSVKEIVDAIMHHGGDEKPELAILPLGTANDFASGCNIPPDPMEALKLAMHGEAKSIDVVRANDEYFANVASGGFGAKVTSTTPVALNNFLGGGAYTLSGLVQAVGFSPYEGVLRLPDAIVETHTIVGAVCNGKQAGGGQVLATNALINDGLLDVVGLNKFSADAIPQVIGELSNSTVDGKYVTRYSVPWAEWESEEVMPINLDGEPIHANKVRFEVVPSALKLVLPDDCPVVS